MCICCYGNWLHLKMDRYYNTPMCHYFGHVSKIVSILLSKLSDCPNTITSLCYCNYPFLTVYKCTCRFARHNMILAGLWYDTDEHPTMTTYLRPLMDSMNSLYEHGMFQYVHTSKLSEVVTTTPPANLTISPYIEPQV